MSSTKLTSREERRVFLRLHEDIGEALNSAVENCIDTGDTKASIARKMGCDRAFLSRLLAGKSGTNLRTIAKVLFATKTRLKVELLSLDDLKRSTRSVSIDKIFVRGSWLPSHAPVSETRSRPVIHRGVIEMADA